MLFEELSRPTVEQNMMKSPDIELQVSTEIQSRPSDRRVH